jgi:hypothetical protein
LVIWRLLDLLDALIANRTPQVDIGTTTIEAVRLWKAGISPYSSPVDAIGGAFSESTNGYKFFGGFKYGPAMIWTYYPGLAVAGTRGLFITNAVAHCATVVLSAAWVGAVETREAAVGVAALALLPVTLSRELFESGVNDAVPVALCIGAFCARRAGYALAAGTLVGLSVGTKILPGAILAGPLILGDQKGRGRAGIAAAMAVIACYFPAALGYKRELVSNLLVFQFIRPPDGTSLVFFLPSGIRQIVRIASWLGVTILTVVSPPAVRDPAKTANRICTIQVVLFWGSSIVHGNYMLWFYPFLAIAVCARVWRRRAVV